MKRFLVLMLLLPVFAMIGCSSDDDDGGTNPPPTGPPRPVAVVKATAPSMTDANDVTWDDVTPEEVTLARSGAAKSPGSKAAVVAAAVDVQAIISGTKLYLRFEWDDDSLNIFKDVWILNNPSNFNFTRNPFSEEDQLLVLFDGLPDEAMDVWHWRVLTTGAAMLAEGYNYSGATYTRDAGAEEVAKDNYNFGDNSRPKVVHKDGSSFAGNVLYQTDTVAAFTFAGGALWPNGFLVPGWYIDSTVASRTLSGPQAQSRWDTQAVSDYDDTNGRYSLVLSRALNTGYADDLDLSPLDSVQIKVILIDDLEGPVANNNSNQSSSSLFWLIL